MRTLDWIQWLLERHWTLRFKESVKLWEWREPNGMSGDEYCSTGFHQLPPAVGRHIQANALRRVLP